MVLRPLQELRHGPHNTRGASVRPKPVEGSPRPLEPKRYVKGGVSDKPVGRLMPNAYQRPNEALSLLLRRSETGRNPGMGSFQRSEP